MNLVDPGKERRLREPLSSGDGKPHLLKRKHYPTDLRPSLDHSSFHPLQHSHRPARLSAIPARGVDAPSDAPIHAVQRKLRFADPCNCQYEMRKYSDKRWDRTLQQVSDKRFLVDSQCRPPKVPEKDRKFMRANQGMHRPRLRSNTGALGSSTIDPRNSSAIETPRKLYGAASHHRRQTHDPSSTRPTPFPTTHNRSQSSPDVGGNFTWESHPRGEYMLSRTMRVPSAKAPLQARAFTDSHAWNQQSYVVPIALQKPKNPTSNIRSSMRPSMADGSHFIETGDKQPQSRSSSRQILNLEPSGAVVSSHPYHPLRAEPAHTEVLANSQETLSSSSSVYDVRSTERSSIGTPNTSISAFSVSSLQKEVLKHDSWTVDDTLDMYAAGFDVDDAIDLYAAGFGDDEEIKHDSPESIPPEPTSLPEEAKGSEQPAEATNSKANHCVNITSQTPNRDCDSLEATVPASSTPQSDLLLPPPLRAPTASRDQYGFLKANQQITNSRYDVWNSSYNAVQERRFARWLSYMKEEGLPTDSPLEFPPRCAKTQRFIRKGIPPVWRGAAWFWYAGAEDYLQRDPDLYSMLVSCCPLALNQNDRQMIERDLHRTFPDNVHFKPDDPTGESTSSAGVEAPLLSSLRRVLQAFALCCPRIGYCQSLNFIAGLLLLFMSEEKVFWMLRIITSDYLPGTHSTSLEGANIDMWVLMAVLKEQMPGFWAKTINPEGNATNLDAKLPPVSLCTTSWFMSLFIGTLPIESVLRVWDMLFYEGSKTIFRVALGIFKLGEQRIKTVKDPMEIIQLVQTLPREMLDVVPLIKVACRRGGVSQEWVDKKRRERRLWYSRARASSTGSMVLPRKGTTRRAKPSTRKRPVWNVRAKPSREE